MLATSGADTTIRRLMRERTRPQATTAAGGADDIEENVSLTIRRLEHASVEMDRLRSLAAAHESTIYEQKQEIANAHREVANACELVKAQKSASDRARAELEAEVAALRSQIGRLAAAVTGSFNFDETVELRAVA